MLRLFSSRIQQAKVTLTHNETELLRSLSAQAGVIPRATITELAQSVFSSPSTIHRLIRKLGFKGYTDFKVRVEDSLESELPLVLAQPNLLKITISSIEHTFRLEMPQGCFWQLSAIMSMEPAGDKNRPWITSPRTCLFMVKAALHYAINTI